MPLPKNIRYYYWVILEFLKKHLRLIALSFLISFIGLVAFISLSPYFEGLFENKKQVIGIVGRYDPYTMPEEIISKISNGLVYINERGEIIPTLSTSWEVANGGKLYRFHLRDNLIWNDDVKFFPADINYQFKDVTLKVIDDKTIDFRLQKPIPIFPTYLRKPLIRYPLIGIAGLYKISRIKWQYDFITQLSLEANKKGLPLIVYKFYYNEGSLVAAYKKGEINQMNLSKKSVADIFLSWKNSQVSKTVDYSRLMTLFFNLGNPLLENGKKDLREAIVMGVDQYRFKEMGEIANGPIQPVSWAYNPNLKKVVYDVDNANKIVKRIITATQSAQFNLVTYYDYYDSADEIVTMLKKIGLAVSLNIISGDKPNNFDLLLAYWKIPPDPDQYYFWHSTQTIGNIGGYGNVKIDKLLEEGRDKIAVDDREKIYFDFQKTLLDDPPAVFLYYPYVYTIKRK